MTKKKIIGLVVAVLVIGGLSALVYFVSQLDLLPQDPQIVTDLNIKYARESLVLYSCVLEDVAFIHVKNPTGEYTVTKDEEGNIYFVGRKGAPLLPYSSVGLYESIAKVTCEALIEIESENLDHYGLDNPQVTVVVEMKDGKTATLAIGDAAQQGGGYYIRNVTNNDVYLAQTYFSERFLRNHVQYYQTTLGKVFDYSGFQSLAINYPEYSEKKDIYVRMTTDEEATDIKYIGGTVVEKPFLCGGDSAPIQEIIEIVTQLTADDIITDTLDENMRSQYGFDDPIEVIIEAYVDTQNYVSTLTGLENPYYGATEDGSPLLISCTYLLGNIDGRMMYVMYDGEPVIYGVDMDKFAFVNYSVDVFCQNIINLRYLKDLNSMKIEFNGEVYDFSIENPEAGEEMIVMYDTYTKIDPTLFRSFYASVIGISQDGLAFEPEEGAESVLTITLGAIEGDDDVLEFIQIDTRKFMLQINGESVFYVNIPKVNKVKNDLMKLLNGEEIFM